MCDEGYVEVVNVNPDNYTEYIDPTAKHMAFWVNPEGEIITLWDAPEIAFMMRFDFGMSWDEVGELMPEPADLLGAVIDEESDIHPWLDIEFCIQAAVLGGEDL
jgi:hypothetical protein